MPKHIIVAGGGAAGIFAAIKAREMGADVTIAEKNDQLGKKILITGKGRCNLTNAGTISHIIENMPGNGSFLYSALHVLSNTDVIDFFFRMGLSTKVERGGRVFPESDRARDVVETLTGYIRKIGVKIKYRSPVDKLIIENSRITGVSVKGRILNADAVVLTTGGATYPGTGSTGDGYRMAKEAGHRIIPLEPSLVPLETEESWKKELQGLSLKNVEVTCLGNGDLLGSEFGEMLFTHFGVSGPIILTLSRPAARFIKEHPEGNVRLLINLKPALSPEQLDQRLQREFQKYSRKQLSNAFGELLPKSLIPVFVRLLPIAPDKPVHQVKREERLKIVDLLRSFPVTVTRTRPLSEGIVTAGGVSTKEVNPKTMESKLVQGLFFAGEVLDIDGFTGGYNLQAAFSTGYVAGMRAAE